MKVEELKDTLISLDLAQYAKLRIGYIGLGDHEVSIVKEGDFYNVYTSSEKGNPHIQGEHLSQDDACEEVISIFQHYKDIYEYFEKKGLLEESGLRKYGY